MAERNPISSRQLLGLNRQTVYIDLLAEEGGNSCAEDVVDLWGCGSSSNTFSLPRVIDCIEFSCMCVCKFICSGWFEFFGGVRGCGSVASEVV